MAGLDIPRLRKVRDGGRPIAMLTAYDYPTGRLVDESGVDVILVGDSLGMVVLGYENTTSVTLEEMCHHTRATRRGVTRSPLVADLPFRTYETPADAVASAKKLVEAGADVVKLEGGREIASQIEAILGSGIPVMGHLGMLPQHILEEGRYRKKGRTDEEADRLLSDAQMLSDLGVRGIVLESMFKRVAKRITEEIAVPTIGIGSGKHCDGQVLVVHDLIGAFPWFCPPFATPKTDVAGDIRRSVEAYVAEVKALA